MSMSATATRPYHHGDLRNACVRAALELLEAEGLEALTLRAVAERAGVSRSAPYRHFETKRALLAATAEEGFRLLTDALDQALRKASNDATERLRDGCAAYARFGARYPCLYRLMFAGDLCEGPLFDSEEAPEDSEFPELAAAGEAAYDVLINALASAQQTGAIRAREPRSQALAVWAAIHGVMSLYLDNRTSYAHHETEALEAVVSSVLDVVAEGLQAGNVQPAL